LRTWRSFSVAKRARRRREPALPVALCATVFALFAVAGSARAEHGVCLAHAWGFGEAGYGSATAQKTLERLKKLGVDAVSLTPFGFMTSPSSDTVHLIGEFRGGETDSRVAAMARQAHAAGMRVMLKPHIWLHGGSWCGALTLPDDAAWARWFESYRAFIVHYAKLAEAEKIESLTLGVELKSATVRERGKWQSIIAEVRAAYHGTLVYAANWDEAEHVVFWDLVDQVGVDEYDPADWKTVLARLGALAARTKKPIVITEVGYDAKLGVEKQAQALRAALAALGSASFVRGVYVWKWFTDSGVHDDDSDFSPADKPAEAVLGEFYRRRPSSLSR
jgi:hypothetical protein